jgi:hypothetical protein
MDHSIMILDSKEKVISLLPACENGKEIYSHSGLTYGGFILGGNIKISEMNSVFEITLRYYRERKFCKIYYKTIPSIYHMVPAEEDRYFLFLKNASLYRRDILSVVFISC